MQASEAPQGPGEKVPVLVVDLEGLLCVEGAATEFTRSGCRFHSERIGELSETVGLRLNGLDKMIRGRIVSSANCEAVITFEFESASVREKRKESRRTVRIPARISDRRGGLVIPSIIVDASKSGCRVEARDLDMIPAEVRLHIPGLDMPVNGEIKWRGPGCAGVQLLWQFSKESDLKVKPVDAADKNALGPEAGAGRQRKRRADAFGTRGPKKVQ
ncbi:PilZ domain-containing protein [Roseibium litorale]|uniref:PilZ domain-containing protein n=1 Tax=Roseibium litorale TaxID=2803841 RepID=A0ABR9CQG7_9HYPH|nr:PilZ domain-containing protein [Roseibium litorale]MBD8893059.1 PilZ domain-containing protein [Roseibium litorale]